MEGDFDSVRAAREARERETLATRVFLGLAPKQSEESEHPPYNPNVDYGQRITAKDCINPDAHKHVYKE